MSVLIVGEIGGFSTECCKFKPKSKSKYVITPANHYKDKTVKKIKEPVNTCGQCEVSGNVCHHLKIAFGMSIP